MVKTHSGSQSELCEDSKCPAKLKSYYKGTCNGKVETWTDIFNPIHLSNECNGSGILHYISELPTSKCTEEI